MEQKSAYKFELQRKLETIQTRAEQPLSAQGLHCQDLHCPAVEDHSEVRDSLVLDLLSAIIESSHATMPTYGGCWVGGGRSGVSTPGWSTAGKPFRDNSIYWGNIWRATGRKTAGWVFENYKEARKQYHYAVLRARRAREKHQAEQLLAAAMEGDIVLLKEMKSIKKGGNPANCDLPDTVGGADGEQNIAEMFRDSYNDLFNSASSDEEMKQLKIHLNSSIGETAKKEVAKVP